MICPKCKKQIEDSATVCPYCKKVLTLVCPKCGALNDSVVCQNCNYIILGKCTKCGKLNKTDDGSCACGTSTVASSVNKYVNSERYSAITVSIGNIGKLEKALGSKKLVTKFLFKLKNLVSSFAKEETREMRQRKSKRK